MYALLIIVFGLLQVADGVVTYLGLNSFGLEEVNPVLNACAELMGLGYSIALIKMAGLAFIALLFLERHKMKSRWIKATLTSAVAFYSWVVTNNVLLVMEA
ncbi:DUF5658 family protein [Methylocaldum sp. MU1018]